MTKPTTYQPIDPSDLSISNDPYTGRERTNEGKYAEIFCKVKQGQRIVCPPDLLTAHNSGESHSVGSSA